MAEKLILHDAIAMNDRMRKLIRETRIDCTYMHKERSVSYKQEIVERCAGLSAVLDIGRCMREYHDKLDCGQVDTLDINDFGDYPNIVADICQPFPKEFEGRYDAIVALSILEHVYDPFAAIANIRHLLKPGGTAFIYVPFLFRYHSPPDNLIQDYYRFTRDGVAYLFREFDEVTIYPVRGRYSTIANMFLFWKRIVERRMGSKINKLLDLPVSRNDNILQASGYNITAVK